MPTPWIATLVSALVTGPAAVDEGNETTATHQFLVDTRGVLGRPWTMNPDEPRVEAGFSGPRAQAMLGGAIGIWGIRRPHLDAVIGLSSFFQISNIELQAVPWQLMRANFGLMTSWHPKTARLDRAGTSLYVSAGWLHESDHAVDSATFSRDFVFPGFSFDNGNLSSFEYFDLELIVSQRWPTRQGPPLRSVFGVGVRPYTPPINRHAARQARIGLRGETRFEVDATDRLTVWLGAYGDWTYNRFVPAEHAIRRDPDDVPPGASTTRPRATRAVRVGVATPAWGRVMLVPQVGYENSDGRSIDFMRRYGHTYFAVVSLFW